MADLWTWLAIALCVSQSATFSGLNIALFSLSRLRLEVAAAAGDADAAAVLALRRDGNTTLATILWGNVAINVLLTLLAESVLAGLGAFLFSTLVITLVGEIVPQATFTRHALRVGARLAPVVRFYRVLLWPLARPVGLILDRTVGAEAIPWFREHELRDVLRYQAKSRTTEVGTIEATGAINFLALDDLTISQEGEPLDPESIIALPYDGARPRFPRFERTPSDPFLRALAKSGYKWVVITDLEGEPRHVVRAPQILRLALFSDAPLHLNAYCHHPLIVRDPQERLGLLLPRLSVRPESPEDDVIDEDLILLWTADTKRIVTGSDILGRLLRRIARNTAHPRI